MKKYLLLGLLTVVVALPAAAQARRTIAGLQLWPELQGELALKGGDYLLLALRGQHDTDINGTSSEARFLGFDERRLTLGYEHFWSPRWSGGATLRYVGSGGSYDFVLPELLLRHRSLLGGFYLGQRLSLERDFAIERAASAGSTAPNGQTWARLRLDLEKTFPVGRLALRPRLSYEAATHLRLQKDDTEADERTIQFTSIRAEVGLRLSTHFDITPWLAYQTRYLITLPQFDANGQQTSGGSLNAITPTVGLEARLTLFQGKTEFERQQLPTQH
jgi:hypothetical protein